MCSIVCVIHKNSLLLTKPSRTSERVSTTRRLFGLTKSWNWNSKTERAVHKKIKRSDFLFWIKYKSFLEAKTKLNYSKRSLIHKSRKTELDWPESVICAVAGERRGGGSRLANHVLWSHFVTTNRERSIHWLYNSWSRKVETQNTEIHELRDSTVFLPQCGKSFIFLILCSLWPLLTVSGQLFVSCCACSWHLQPK